MVGLALQQAVIERHGLRLIPASRKDPCQRQLDARLLGAAHHHFAQQRVGLREVPAFARAVRQTDTVVDDQTFKRLRLLGSQRLAQQPLGSALEFDILTELSPVALLPSVPYWMTARKTLPPNTLQELVAYLKANPDKVSATSVGTASVGRFCGMFFQHATGTTFQFVPYRGGAPAMQDIVAGNVDLNCDLAANSLSQFKSGNLKVYAVMSKQRWFAAPDVPTTDEAGVPDVHVGTWHGLWMPKGTPEDVVARVNAAARAAMDDPTVQKRIADLGMNLPPADIRTPAAFAAFHKAEVEKWYPIVKAAGVKAE